MGIIHEKKWMEVTKILIEEKDRIWFGGFRLNQQTERVGQKITEKTTLDEAIEFLQSFKSGSPPTDLKIEKHMQPIQTETIEKVDINKLQASKSSNNKKEINILGFIKVKNEIMKGNLFRCLTNLKHYCDEIVAFDDNSTDGSRYYLEMICGEDNVIGWDRKDGFEHELEAKQNLLKLALSKNPKWILWLDGDEILDLNATLGGLKEFCAKMYNKGAKAYRMHETQLWNSTSWARTDEGFDDGSFVRLWRVPDNKELHFDIKTKTHHIQFPREYIETGLDVEAPFECIHYGNASIKHIQSKCMQYFGGLGSWKRHLYFNEANYRPVPKELFPPYAEHAYNPETPKPIPQKLINQILKFQRTSNEGRVIIVMPTYNKEKWIEMAIESVLNQSYQDWILYILDDGSTDSTPAICKKYANSDARIFYLQYPENRGACVLTNIGIDIAIERGEFFSIIGSDDAWKKDKLLQNVDYLKKHGDIGICFSKYQVMRKNNEGTWDFAEICNDKLSHEHIEGAIKRTYCVGIANIMMRTSTLKILKRKFGTDYCEANALKQMNDWILIYKLTKVGKFGWHDGCEAFWRDNVEEGASHTKVDWYNQDQNATLELIRKFEGGD